MSNSPSRRLSTGDKLIDQFDRALRTLTARHPHSERPNPAVEVDEAHLKGSERRHAAGLMRVNHAGEVCAQALYQGQALTAKLPKVRAEMEMAASEEQDHLAWCQRRLDELDSHTSRLNPLWYGLSFGIGAAAGLVSDKISLGFVAATEDQVCKHLRSHLESLPPQDAKSRAIVNEMLADETHHAHSARAAGGADFPAAVKTAMTGVSRLMTKTSYYL